MPSEAQPTLVDQAMTSLAPRIDAFHSAVATAEEEVRTYVHQHRGQSQYKTEQALVELGPFAVGRIDPDRFAMLMGEAEELTPQSEDVLDRAEAILAHFVGDKAVHEVVVEPGGDLRDAVKDALEEAGRLFGASRAVELARAGTFDPDQHNYMMGKLGFRHWNRSERQLAPPLIVEVRGEDCLPAGLGEFLDGTVTIVLVVNGPTTPAPLARLITPGTFVMQTADPTDLARLAASRHPAVALLFDQERAEQARFFHDPDAGSTPAARLTVQHMPEMPDVGRGRRAPTWLEELQHLHMLVASGEAGSTDGAPSGDGAVAGDGRPPAATNRITQQDTPADQLAAWLLSQTDLDGV